MKKLIQILELIKDILTLSREESEPCQAQAPTGGPMLATASRPLITVSWTGKMSTFGGPADTGVTPNEGLALFTKADLGKPIAGNLFLPKQPAGTTGMARRLNPASHYIAMRWNYKENPVEQLRLMRVTVSANGKVLNDVRPVDWGPALWTERVMDISPSVANFLDLSTDDEATVTYSY